MTDRMPLSDVELREAVEDFRAMIAGKPDAGYRLTNGDVLRLLEELVSAREREAASEWDDGNGRNALRRLIGPWEPRPGICPECGYGIDGVDPIYHYRHLREEDND